MKGMSPFQGLCAEGMLFPGRCPGLDYWCLSGMNEGRAVGRT